MTLAEQEILDVLELDARDHLDTELLEHSLAVVVGRHSHFGSDLYCELLKSSETDKLCHSVGLKIWELECGRNVVNN